MDSASVAQGIAQASFGDAVAVGGATATPVRARNLRAVDLFAGAGGLSLAARLCGIQVLAAVEMDRHACATYRKNLIDTLPALALRPALYERDVREEGTPERLRDAHFTEHRPCDLILGGPPCQGFSVHRFKDLGVGDPRNELVLRYFDFVKCLRPKVFLLENVPGLLWPRHRPMLDSLLAEARAAGYRVCGNGPIPLDARDYGVPQRRKRVFILGVRVDVHFDDSRWPPAATHGNEAAWCRSPHLLPWEPARAAFDPAPKGDQNDRHMNHSAALTERFEATPQNGGSRGDVRDLPPLPCHLDYDGHSDVYGRIDPDQPAPTMTTACINPSKGRFVHPTEPHGITIRQAARLQTFPDHFVFKGGLMAAGVQIGNAVPVKLGERLLGAVLRGLGVAPAC
jgi:DNA (cytosine-5)-methyltransferase 1